MRSICPPVRDILLEGDSLPEDYHPRRFCSSNRFVLHRTFRAVVPGNTA